MTDFQVVVMAKAPIAGEVKTRLCPPLTYDQAAVLAQAALFDTMAAVSASRARRRVLALQGSPGIWLTPGFDVIPQRSGDFGSRLAGAIDDAWATFPVPILVVGMDTPQLGGADLDSAARMLIDAPDQAGPSAVIGPAEDGGYWVIGVSRPVSSMFDGVPMSTDGTMVAQRSRLQALGVSCASTRLLRDVDQIEDAMAVAGLAPGTLFAAALQPMMARITALAGDGHEPTAACAP
jgi:hypothetical protein